MSNKKKMSIVSYAIALLTVALALALTQLFGGAAAWIGLAFLAVAAVIGIDRVIFRSLYNPTLHVPTWTETMSEADNG